MNNADGVTNSTYQKTGHKLVYVELNIKQQICHSLSFLRHNKGSLCGCIGFLCISALFMFDSYL